MKYPPIAHIVNFLFLGAFVSIPIFFCLKTTSLSDDMFRLILFATFIFGVLIFADWYHIYFTNTYKSILMALITGICASVLCITAASYFNEKTIFALSTFKENSWDGSRFFLRFYVTGLGIAFSAI